MNTDVTTCPSFDIPVTDETEPSVERMNHSRVYLRDSFPPIKRVAGVMHLIVPNDLPTDVLAAVGESIRRHSSGLEVLVLHITDDPDLCVLRADDSKGRPVTKDRRLAETIDSVVDRLVETTTSLSVKWEVTK